MVRCRRGQLMIYGFELLGFRSESRGPVHSGPDHRTSAPYHTELSSMEIKLKINCSHEKKNCFFSEQITIAVGYELANDLSLLGTLYIQYPEGTCRTQTARGSYDINLGYYVTSFKGTVQPFERWFLRRISALLIEKTN